MKLKLQQRIAIGFYKSKIKAIRFFSKEVAAKKTFQLFCTPYSGKPKRKAPAIFHHAKNLSFQFNNLTIKGWQWLPNAADYTHTVLIVHGFDSCSYGFDKLINAILSQKKYRILAYDAPAHGVSEGKFITALDYKNTIENIEKKFGPIDIIISHSFGGLATCWAASNLTNVKKIVLAAPATATTTALDNFFKIVTLGEEIKADVIQLIENIAGTSIQNISIHHFIQHLHQNFLWVHDEDDWICPINDVKKTMALQLPNINFLITKGLGHSKIYRKEAVMKAILDFI